MNKVNKKAGIITGIIFIAILFSNIIYAGNSSTDDIYVEEVTVLGGNNIVTNGSRVNITIKTKESIDIKDIKINIGDSIIRNMIAEIYDKGNGEYIVSYKIPDKIEIGDNNQIFQGDNVKLGYTIVVNDKNGSEIVLESGQDNIITYYNRLDESILEKTTEINSNLTVFKKGNEFNVRLKTSHPVNINNVEILGINNVESLMESDDSKMNWNITFKFGECDKDIENVSYNIEMEDGLDSYILTTNTGLAYHRTLEIKDFHSEVYGDNSKTFVKEGDVIIMSFTLSYPVNDIEGRLNTNSNIVLTQSKDNQCRYEAQYLVKNEGNFDSKMLELILEIKEEGTEKQIITKELFMYYGNILNSIYDFKSSADYVKDGDRLTITFKTKRPVTVEEMTIGGCGVDCNPTDSNNLEWKAELQIDKGMFDNDNFSMECSYKIFDNNIGDSVIYTKECAVYYAPIEVKNFNIISDNSKSGFVKNGDKLTVSFETTHPVNAAGSTLRMSEDLEMSFSEEKDDNEDICRYVSEVEVKNDEKFDNKKIGINLILNDSVGNETLLVPKETDIIYYAPIEICNFKIESSNENGDFAKDGDKIKIIIETKHLVKAECRIMENSKIIKMKLVENKSQERCKYECEIEVENNEKYDYKKIKVSLALTDDAGNSKQENKGSNIKYYAPIEIFNTDIKSDKKNSNLAKNGDKIKITIETKRPVKAECRIMENSKIIEMKPVENKSQERCKYECEIEVEDNENYDDKNIKAILNLTDEAGNSKKEIKDSKIKYYAPIKILNTEIKSSNENDAFAKDGDKIKIIIKTKHPVKAECRIMENLKSEKMEPVENKSQGKYEYECEIKVENNKKYDDKKIKVSLDITDEAGNSKKESTDSGITYYAPIEISNIDIKSGNKNGNLAKNGDKIKITIETNHLVKAECRIVENLKSKKMESVKNKSQGKYTYECEIEVENNEKYDYKKIEISLDITDEAGNSKKESTDSGITYYAPIEISNTDIKSGNKNCNLAKNGDKIKITIETNHPVKAECRIMKNLKSEKMEPVENKSQGKYEYECEIKVENNKKYDDKKIEVSLDITDDAGNSKKESTDSGITYYAPIEISNTDFKSSNKNGNLAKDGDKIKITIETKHPVKAECRIIENSEIKVMKPVKNKSQGKYKYECEIKVKNNEKYDNKKIKVNLNLTDAAGNSKKERKGSSITYYAPIEICNFKTKSNNAKRSLAKNGDKIKITIETKHPVKAECRIIENSEIKVMKPVKNKSQGKYKYECEIKVKNNEKYDNKKIKVNLNLTDAAGNSKKERKGSSITYYAPIEICNFKTKSNNAKRSLAKNGDKIKITIETKHPVKAECRIMENSEIKVMESVENKSQGKYKYECEIVVENNKKYDDKKIKAILNLTDAAGNSKKERKGSSITYYAPIKVFNTEIKSDNENGNFAKNGDKIKITIETKHPVKAECRIMENSEIKVMESVENKNQGKYKYECEIEVENNEKYNGKKIKINLYLTDNSGNNRLKSEKSKIIYYEPIKVSNLKINSDNAKDGTLYAKDGNTVAVEFITNHQVNFKESSIAGNIANVSSIKVSDTEYRWRVDYTINNGDLTDLSNIGFNILIDDNAKNESVYINQDNDMLQNIITYFAPITAVTDYKSDYNDGTYLKNGDTITVNCKASHPVSTIGASIAGRQASVQGNDTTDLSMIYTIPQNEGTISEGDIQFEYTIEDKAGNELNVKQVSDSSVVKNIIYDRTLPVVNISHDNTEGALFYSDTAKYSIQYTGTNIFEAGMSCMINGVERIGEFKKHPIDDGYRIDIELEEEENYIIKTSCTDLAGNKDTSDTSISVTVDKTNPSLKIVNINTGHIFNSEFTLEGFLNIEENNLKDIDCTLTDNEGTHDWDIKDIIEGDGKKTITLKMTDMAGNVSDTYVYEFYVDMTAPSPVIIDKDSGYLFKQGKNTQKFNKNLNLSIFLDEINVGKEPDKFTSIKLLDKNENEYMDVIKSGKTEEDGSYTIRIDKDGEYTLNVQAVDSVGNETGLCRYSFMVGEKAWYIRFYENTPLFVVAIVSLSLLSIMTAAVLIIKKKQK